MKNKTENSFNSSLPYSQQHAPFHLNRIEKFQDDSLSDFIFQVQNENQ